MILCIFVPISNERRSSLNGVNIAALLADGIEYDMTKKIVLALVQIVGYIA